METLFQPTSRHIALLAVLWPKSKKELYDLVRRYYTRDSAILGIMTEAKCKEKLAENLYEVGKYMITPENINQNLLN